LVEPAEEYAAAAAEMAADFEAAGEERADLPDVAAYIKRCRAYARGAVPKGHVPTTTYWLVGDDGAVPPAATAATPPACSRWS
jgi:hypothetical protein